MKITFVSRQTTVKDDLKALVEKKLARLDMITKWLMISAGVVFCVLLVCVMFFN